jgi:LmbE family N-acetylglucosaminyl deacetylase
MAGAASNADPGAFMNTPVARVAARLASLLEQHRPDVVVTYPADGGYGHPDHIHVHRATVAAVRDVEGVRKLYFTARSAVFRQRMQRVRDKLVASAQGAQPPLRPPATATAAADITTVVDTLSTLVRRRAALASHRSQLENTYWLDMPDADFAALFDTETYVRVLDNTGAPVPETDLFAGIS